MFFAALMVAGVFVLFYPAYGTTFNAIVNRSAVEEFTSNTAVVDEEALAAAHEHNTYLGAGTHEEYLNQLASPGTDFFAVVTAPTVGVKQPVYHTDNEDVLLQGAGHMEQTHLPVGGTGTLAAITGHTGIPGNPIFDGLHKIEVGDPVIISVAGTHLTYEVAEKEVVRPTETDRLYPQKGRDLLALITCTPYSVNTHRLFVLAERVEDADMGEATRLAREKPDVSWWWVPPMIVSLVGVGWVFTRGWRNTRPQGHIAPTASVSSNVGISPANVAPARYE